MSMLAARSMTDSRMRLDPFGAARVMVRTVVMDLKSIFGLSALRDSVTTAGTGTVVNNVGDSEFRLTAVAAADAATLATKERGRYVAGNAAEIGMGVRVPQALTGNQTLRWGYFDAANGFYFKLTAAGMSVCVLRAGTEASVAQGAWNIDPLDGSGASGQTLDLARANIFRIQYTWYGYGCINFEILPTIPDGTQCNIVVHGFAPANQTSVMNPNLPLTIELKNNGTAGTRLAFVAGRQYSILGPYSPIYRVTSVYDVAKVINNVWLPYLTVRKKAAYNSVCVKILALDLNTTVDSLVSVRVGPVLTGSTFAAGVPDTVSAETCLEMDVDATGGTGGVVLWTGYAGAGQNAPVTSSAMGEDFQYTFSETENITVFVKAIGSSGTITCVMRLREEW